MFPEAVTYLDRLRAHMHLGDGVEMEIVRELETHVEDRLETLVRDGASERDARRLVMGALGRPQTLAHLIRQAHLATPWPEALFGAAPFLLASLLIGARLWEAPALAASSSAIVVAVTLYGLLQGRPAWFYPWAGVALALPIVAGYIAFSDLQQQLPALAAGRAGPLDVLGVAGAGLYFPIGLLVVAGAARVALRRDWLDASVLLSPLSGVFVWIIAIHRGGGLLHASDSIAGTSELLGTVYFCMALATVAFLRSQSRVVKVATIIGSAVLFVSIGTPVDSEAALATAALRAVLLAAFLLSPALAVRRSLER